MARVLLIDDDFAVGDSTRELLSASGHEVVAVCSGAEGISAAKAAAFDVAITDMLMPDMDGFEVIGALRALHPKLKIIAISGARQNDTPLYLSAAAKLGADAFLEKPLRVEDLLAVLKGV